MVTLSERFSDRSVRKIGWFVPVPGMSTRWIGAYGQPLWCRRLAAKPTSDEAFLS